MSFTVEEFVSASGAVIKVIGVGGGGGNAVKYMAANSIDGVEFICANTDAQALKGLGVERVIQLGAELTKGLGAGANPEVGRQAAIEARDLIVDALQGTHMLFVTTGMGGGTGTGAIPVIAAIAKDMGILTVAVVTSPFPFEGSRRKKHADEGIKQLQECVDSLITIPNEKLQELLGKDVPLTSAFSKADDVLCGAVRGITDIIKRPGMINVDFADIRAIMSDMGLALMGTGTATGPNRAKEAAELAIRNPLLSGVSLKNARGILVNITAGPDLSLGEYSDVGAIVEEFASDDAVVKVGTVVDPELRDELHVTVVATGLEHTPVAEKQSPAHQIPAVRPSQIQAEPERRQAPSQYLHEHEQLPPFHDHTRTLAPGAYQPSQGQDRGRGHQRHELDQRDNSAVPQAPAGQDLDYLDVPTFLRNRR